MRTKIKIIELVDGSAPNIGPTVVTEETLIGREGSKIERLGVSRERAAFLMPFVGQTMSRSQFDDLLLEVL